jgi:hypothetical protein
MKLFFGSLICIVTLAIPVVVLAGGSQSGFDGVVSTIELRYNAHPTRIPFLSLIGFIGRKATHEGVANLHLAEFENLSQDIDGSELNQIVEEKLGSGWERIIRETSKHGGEQTLIFTHPEGQRMGLFVIDKENHELTVVQVSVDPNHLDDDIGHYSHHHDPNHDISD